MKIGMSLGMRGQRGLTQIQRAIAFLRTLGTSAHVWAPGSSGVSVASLPSNNYLLSDGSTGYSTVDGVDGLTLDAMGALGSELVTNGTFGTDTSGWTAVNSPALSVSASGVAIQNAGATNGLIYRATTTVSGKTYKISASIVYGGVGVARVEPSNTIPTTVGGGHISVTASGAYECFFTATATTTYIVVGNRNDSNATHTYDNISVKEYTGTHLTQATTANRPLVRRGAYNLLPYSNFTSGWGAIAGTLTANAVAAPDGTTTAASWVSDGTSALHRINTPYTSVTIGGVYTTSVTLKAGLTRYVQLTYGGIVFPGTAYVNFDLQSGVVSASGGSPVASGITSLGNGFYRCWIADTAAATSASGTCLLLALITGSETRGPTTTGNGTYTLYAPQIEAGAAPSEYTPTTATAASNPSAGKYWWSFDGSNDSLLSGNLGITNACTIIVAGRVNSLATTQMMLAEDTDGLAFYIEGTTGIVIAGKNGTAQLLNSTGNPVAAGVPFVVTFRLSGGTAVIRKNGVQVATGATALTFSAITGARIGTNFAGTSYPLNGALGWVIPLPTALSDADCLTVERLAASQFPNGPIF